jgi:thioredoxin 2
MKLNRLPIEEQREPVCGQCKSPLPFHDGITEADDRTLPKLIEASPLPVVVDAWASWCGPCRVFAPTFQRVARAMADRFAFAKLDTEKVQAMSGRLGVRSIPTLIVFKNGRELTRISGAMPEPQFRQWLESQLLMQPRQPSGAA